MKRRAITSISSVLYFAIFSATAADLTVVTDGSIKLKSDSSRLVLPSINPFVVSVGSLTAGVQSVSCNGNPHIKGSLVGFISPTLGAYSPTSLGSGRTLANFYDSNCAGPNAGAWISVSGFTSSPGAAWISNATCNGVVNTGTAAAYSYTGGVATWHWTTRFGFKAGSYSCSINHN